VAIVIGTQFYAAGPDGTRRQRQAQQAILALDDVRPINLQFADETVEVPGFETLAVLTRDSRTVTGAAGPRKPIVPEMFDALADTARARGCRYFVYFNADIEVTGDAVARVRDGGLDGYAFSRLDVDAVTREDPQVQRFGVDMFAIDAGWWSQHRGRFRPYIAGEACWDNVYAAVLCAHGRADIVDEAPGILHERHDTRWGDGVFAHYNGYLAALDAAYFTQWARFIARREAAPAVARQQVIAEVFMAPDRSPVALARHAARSLRAWWRYRSRATVSR